MKPNIVFILSDDQGYYSLGSLHNSELKTPNLDTLAQEGIHFSQFFCASPVCSPARASILTGCCPSAHGIHDWIRAGNLTPDEYDFDHVTKEQYDYLVEHKAIPYLQHMQTYTDRPQENGYTCALSGKWMYDGSKEDVTGQGQLCKCGVQAVFKDIYYPRRERKEG